MALNNFSDGIKSRKNKKNIIMQILITQVGERNDTQYHNNT